MCCSLRVRASTLSATLTLAAACAVAACSGSQSGAGATTTEAAPFAIQVSQVYLTIENRTGVPIAGGELVIIPAGVMPPFTSTLPRLEAGAKRDIMLNTFRGNAGTFSRAIARARRVKVTAKDIAGKTYEYEVPFS